MKIGHFLNRFLQKPIFRTLSDTQAVRTIAILNTYDIPVPLPWALPCLGDRVSGLQVDRKLVRLHIHPDRDYAAFSMSPGWVLKGATVFLYTELAISSHTWAQLKFNRRMFDF